ncbi:MAG TPA: tail fiber domain-containing protein [Xanthobacteraceae bacterium]
MLQKDVPRRRYNPARLIDEIGRTISLLCFAAGGCISGTKTFTATTMFTGGNVGITTASSGNPLLGLWDTTDGGWLEFSQGGTLHIAESNTSGGFVATALAITAAGNVGLGTASLCCQLDVENAGNFAASSTETDYAKININNYNWGTGVSQAFLGGLAVGVSIPSAGTQGSNHNVNAIAGYVQNDAPASTNIAPVGGYFWCTTIGGGGCWGANSGIADSSGTTTAGAYSDYGLEINVNMTNGTTGPNVFGLSLVGASTAQCSSAVICDAISVGTLGSGVHWNYGIDLGVHQPATFVDGAIRIANNQSIVWRNAANNADLTVMNVTTGNNLEIAGSGIGGTFINSGTFPGADNAYHLGQGSNRWIDVYAVNGTIQTSDRREKKSFEPLPRSLPIVMAVKPETYLWRSGVDSRRHWGLIAQDIDEATKRTGVPFGGIDKSDPARWAMNYSETEAILWEAVRELAGEVNRLKHHER